VISPEQRAELLRRSPHNIVRLTLPESEQAAARTLSAWRRENILVREPEPTYWVLQQDYVGPDGVARTRTGLVAALRVEPYERRTVLPHERTHRGPKEERLRILRATRTQLEPIFLLYRGAPVVTQPEAMPDVELEGTRLWRVEGGPVAGALADRPLLIADGHHRYETAVAFHQEGGGGESGWLPVVLVSLEDPGLTIFPTHRLAAAWNGSAVGEAVDGEPLAALESAAPERSATVAVTAGGARLLLGEPGELDVVLVERVAGGQVTYTPRAGDAVSAVERGEAGAAFLVRPPDVEAVFAAAERGEVMPQKTTYFFPKLLSGLLLLPLDGGP
jgi:uncharacterized protein (DUF1015 family)